MKFKKNEVILVKTISDLSDMIREHLWVEQNVVVIAHTGPLRWMLGPGLQVLTSSAV